MIATRTCCPKKFRGVDLGLVWRSPRTSIGRFNLSVNVAHLDTFFLQPSPGIQTLLDARLAGQINAGTLIAEQGDLVRRNGKPRWKWNASLTWNAGDVQVGAYTQYTGSVLDSGLADSAGTNWVIDGTQTANLYVQFRVRNDRAPDFRWRIGVRNLTDEAPPLSSDGYLGSLYNPYGRYWYTSVRVSL